ncbi:MAG: hypothetical protein A2V84_13395 [Chloroflexi bacterium RBG_16_70_13]|nr:MAG: hypothetical protein A2V84_13395 [Chloroflexi bacterium RBG_16_70_13]
MVGQVGATGRDAIRSRAFKPRAIVPARGAIAAVVAAQAAIAVAAEAWPVFTRPIIARPVFTRPIIAWPIIAWPVFSGSIVPARGPVPAVVAAWPAIPVAITNARPILAILAGRWRRQRSGRSRLALRGGAAKLGAGRGEDPGRLGAHAQHAPAAGREDLEVEVVEAGAEGLAGESEGLLDGLAGELSVGAHVSDHSS